MKENYWGICLTEKEIKEIWEEGVINYKPYWGREYSPLSRYGRNEYFQKYNKEK